MDDESPRARLAVLLQHFSELDDEREAWRVVYPIAEVLLLVTCATIASCDDFEDMSLRSMAAAAGISYSSVQRIWRAHGLKPHLVETFKVSRDKNFAAKVTDVVGLYLNPPDKALVLCVDEKSQIQALDRSQPGLPMKKGRAGTMTHDYKRNGTTTLFVIRRAIWALAHFWCSSAHSAPISLA